MNRIKVAAFDQVPLFRAGIVQVLNAEASVKVVAEGETIPEAYRLCAQRSVDVAIVEADLLEGGPAFEHSLGALCRVVKVILLRSVAQVEGMRPAFAAGVRGYLTRMVGKHELLEAVRAVYRGEGYISPTLAAELMLKQANMQRGEETSPLAHLTHREEQIYTLLSAGMTNQEIGARLNIAERTVKHYVTRIYALLNVRNRVEAAGLSSQRGPARAAVLSGGNDVNTATAGVALCRDTAHNFLSDFVSNGTPEEGQSVSTIFGCSSEVGEDSMGTHILLRHCYRAG